MSLIISWKNRLKFSSTRIRRLTRLERLRKEKLNKNWRRTVYKCSITSHWSQMLSAYKLLHTINFLPFTKAIAGFKQELKTLARRTQSCSRLLWTTKTWSPRQRPRHKKRPKMWSRDLRNNMSQLSIATLNQASYLSCHRIIHCRLP